MAGGAVLVADGTGFGAGGAGLVAGWPGVVTAGPGLVTEGAGTPGAPVGAGGSSRSRGTGEFDGPDTAPGSRGWSFEAGISDTDDPDEGLPGVLTPGAVDRGERSASDPSVRSSAPPLLESTDASRSTLEVDDAGRPGPGASDGLAPPSRMPKPTPAKTTSGSAKPTQLRETIRRRLRRRPGPPDALKAPVRPATVSKMDSSVVSHGSKAAA